MKAAPIDAGWDLMTAGVTNVWMLTETKVVE